MVYHMAYLNFSIYAVYTDAKMPPVFPDTKWAYVIFCKNFFNETESKYKIMKINFLFSMDHCNKQNLKALKIKIELCVYVLTMLLFYCLNVVQSRLELFYLSFLLNIWFIVIFADCQFTLLCVLIQYLFATSENEQVFDHLIYD